MEEKTYAYEENETNEVILAKMKEDMKELREKVKEERKQRVTAKTMQRIKRNEEIERIQVKLAIIKREITHYNRAGLKEKTKTNILGLIYNLIKDDVEVLEAVDMAVPEE